MIEDPAFYDRALRRLDRFGITLAAALVVVVLLWFSWRDALGTAVGAAFALGSYRNWKTVAAGLGGGEKRARPGAGLIIRSALLVAAMVVIIRYFGVSAWSVLAGLFVSVAAVVLEIVYELVFT